MNAEGLTANSEARTMEWDNNGIFLSSGVNGESSSLVIAELLSILR